MTLPDFTVNITPDSASPIPILSISEDTIIDIDPNSRSVNLPDSTVDIQGRADKVDLKFLFAPSDCRQLILRVAHETPLAGHFSDRKTAMKPKGPRLYHANLLKRYHRGAKVGFAHILDEVPKTDMLETWPWGDSPMIGEADEDYKLPEDSPEADNVVDIMQV
ncbi:hypothetical protein Pcinc_010210 [Petrolisthes cinctipes]|uniref:Uncharacterized protein n=1 Tax=Petrolisthes cinctipes TaxID=88211 RepID=A0AAE1G3I0_PETCI|nr:hypothetical protein Pcinc_010210 [Petrolisthes cinctipes]